jgi:predicted ATPase/DNA-binding CsgD family transcriptional regulator
MPTHSSRNVPVRNSPLIGRAHELDSAIATLRSVGVRLLTISGAAGVGKSRLAAELVDRLASDYPDGAIVIDLITIDDSALLDLELGRRLGLRDPTHREISDQVDMWVVEHSALLVLDNAEHVLGISVRVTQWLAASPTSQVIVTSRHQLNLSIETTLVLDTLAVAPDAGQVQTGTPSPAATLFLHVAGMSRIDRVSPDKLAPVERMCQRLEGLPLAIEQVAAQVPALDAAGLDSLDTETIHAASPPNAVLDHAGGWSVWLLSPSGQQLLRYLSVFNAFTLELVESLAEHTERLELKASVADCLDELSAHHLIVPTEETVAGEPVFRLPRLVSSPALARLIAMDEEDVAREAHARTMMGFAEQRRFSGLRPGRQREISELCANERDLAAALSWLRDRQDGEALLALVESLSWFWYARGFYGESLTWFEEVLRQNLRRSGPRWGQFLTVFGTLLALLGHFHRAHDVLADAWEIHRHGDDALGITTTSLVQGIVATHQRRHDDAERWLYLAIEHAVRIPEPAMVQVLEGIAWGKLGTNAHERGDLEGADHALRQSISIHERSDFTWGRAWALCHLGNVLRDRRILQGAFEASQAVLIAARHHDDHRLVAAGLADIATVLAETNQAMLAGWIWGAVDVLRPAAGSPSPLTVNVAAYSRSRMIARRRLGAVGFANSVKRGAATSLNEVIEWARQAQLQHATSEHIPADADATLTTRERDVLNLLLKGASTEMISSSLGISDRTVSSHVGSLLKKFMVGSRLELISITTQPV